MFVVLGLGSNKAFDSLDSVALLASACRKLSLLLEHISFSSIYRTRPMYVENQPDFYNMAVCGYTKLSADELLEKIHEIEESFGRNRDCEIRNGQRSLDIDIEIYGNEEIHFYDPENPMKNLEIPHPRICERAFVLIPMLEVLPPDADIKKRDVFKKSLAEIGSQGAVQFLSSSEFAEKVANAGNNYGRADTCTESDCN